ncbi:hypothetical protein [Nocardia sp. NPDC050793]|uniref:Ppx/GppA phosphatase family protein n=1 Tax=Nocardia sp. NPDC050793 TaxID=3155159 RepID=UPI0033E3876F
MAFGLGTGPLHGAGGRAERDEQGYRGQDHQPSNTHRPSVGRRANRRHGPPLANRGTGRLAGSCGASRNCPRGNGPQPRGASQPRARQILAGAMVAEATMAALNIDSIEVSPWALREGVVLQHIATGRHRGRPAADPSSLSPRSPISIRSSPRWPDIAETAAVDVSAGRQPRTPRQVCEPLIVPNGKRLPGSISAPVSGYSTNNRGKIVYRSQPLCCHFP